MPGHDDPELFAVDIATRRADTDDPTALGANACDFALLDHVHAHFRALPRIPPRDRIVPCRAAARLPKRAEHRVARAPRLDDRTERLDPFRSDILGLHALKRIGVDRALVAAHLVLGLGQHHHAARTEHDVVVQILTQILIEAAR